MTHSPAAWSLLRYECAERSQAQFQIGQGHPQYSLSLFTQDRLQASLTNSSLCIDLRNILYSLNFDWIYCKEPSSHFFLVLCTARDWLSKMSNVPTTTYLLKNCRTPLAHNAIGSHPVSSIVQSKQTLGKSEEGHHSQTSYFTIIFQNCGDASQIDVFAVILWAALMETDCWSSALSREANGYFLRQYLS